MEPEGKQNKILPTDLSSAAGMEVSDLITSSRITVLTYARRARDKKIERLKQTSTSVITPTEL